MLTKKKKNLYVKCNLDVWIITKQKLITLVTILNQIPKLLEHSNQVLYFSNFRILYTLDMNLKSHPSVNYGFNLYTYIHSRIRCLFSIFGVKIGDYYILVIRQQLFLG